MQGRGTVGIREGSFSETGLPIKRVLGNPYSYARIPMHGGGEKVRQRTIPSAGIAYRVFSFLLYYSEAVTTDERASPMGRWADQETTM